MCECVCVFLMDSHDIESKSATKNEVATQRMACETRIE